MLGLEEELLAHFIKDARIRRRLKGKASAMLDGEN